MLQALLLLLSFSLFAEEIVGRVVRVVDGDTITVLSTSTAQHKIRLQGIDAPEKKQAFGNASRKFLSGLVANREVRVTYAKRDRYGRILGTVFVDGRDINHEMLKAGMAWHYKKYDTNLTYAKAETEARTARRGLWQDKNPTPPETFRHKGRAARSPSAPHHTPVPGVPTPQSTRLLHSSLTDCYTPVQEALTPQSKRLLHSSLARLYTPVEQFKHDGRARLQSTLPVAPVKHSLRQGKSNVITSEFRKAKKSVGV